MMVQISLAVVLAGVLLFIIFAFIECLIKAECTHPNKATYDSYHKQVCVDCLQEFSTKEVKK